MINLFFATIWITVGGVLLYLFYFGAEPRLHLTVLNTRISLGWLALLLAVYNVVRWRSQRQVRTGPPLDFPRPTRHPGDHHAEPLNPEFDFTRQPPASGPAGPPPPAAN